MLAIQQKKSSLTHPQVFLFDGDRLKCEPFQTAFGSIIASNTSSSSERLSYIEQVSTGDLKDLIRSCHFLTPDLSYAETQPLIKRKFGDNYHFVIAFEYKALNLPNVGADHTLDT